MRTTIIIAILLIVSLSVVDCRAANQDEYLYTMPIPKDFKVTAIAGGAHPEYPLYKVEIDASGGCAYYEMAPKDRAGGIFKEVGRFALKEEAVREIFIEIRENKFFSLKNRYVSKGVVDGSFAELTVTDNGKTHRVETRNTAVEGFDNIMMTINIELPAGSKVPYNEILA